MTEQSLFKEIYNRHTPKLKNTNILRKKLVICFSGVPASGKTSIAKIIEKKCKAVRLNKDEIGNIINKIKIISAKKKEGLADKYIFHLLNNWNFKNKLIILDKSIDRQYKKIFDVLKANEFQKFVIRVNIPKSVAIERIEKRNKKNLHEWKAKIDKWFKNFEDSGKNIQADFIFNKKEDMPELLNKIDETLEVII